MHIEKFAPDINVMGKIISVSVNFLPKSVEANNVLMLLNKRVAVTLHWFHTSKKFVQFIRQFSKIIR